MADERRDKDAIMVAAEAFADHSDTFMFDKPGSSGKKGSPSPARRAASSKDLTGSGGKAQSSFQATGSSRDLQSSGKATSSSSSAGFGSPNPNLFDKSGAGDSAGKPGLKRRNSQALK